MPRLDNDEIPNPYAPPVALPRRAPPALGRLASRSRRLIGHLFDFAFTFLAGVLLSHVYSRVIGAPRSASQVKACILAATAAQWGLIAWRGQTVGKLLVRTRISLANGANPGFVHGVALRAWPVFFVQCLSVIVALPAVGAIASLILVGDALLIVREDRRCVHDHMAGTFVVDARG